MKQPTDVLFDAQWTLHKCVTLSLMSMWLITLLMVIYNASVTHYPGNIYISVSSIFLILPMVLIYLGLKIAFPARGFYFKYGLFYFGLYVLVLWTIGQYTNAIQLSPFKPIDSILYQVDKALHLDIAYWVMLIQQYPLLKAILELSYASLNYQIIVIPLLLILFKQYNHYLKSLFLLSITTLLGFAVYYVWPTVGPATLLELPIFNESQFATGLKFNQIHQFKPITTIDGGLIAFPSFHVIWALVFQFATRPFPILFIPLAIINTLLIASCVLLGWHYFIDVFSGIALFLVVLITFKKRVFQQTATC